LAKGARRKRAAVAYVNTGARELLPLRAGDILVVDMSLNAVRQGLTNPWEVAKFVKGKVDVFTCSNLHGKVYLFDRCVAVGSANASNHSTRLLECVAISRDPKLIAQVGGFIAAIARERVTPGYIRVCKKEYKPPTHPGSKGPRKKEAQPQYSRLWVIGTEPTSFSDAEARLNKQQEKHAAALIRNRRRYEVEAVRWEGQNAFRRTLKPGDQIIELYASGRSVRTYPPSRVLRCKPYKSSDSKNAERMFIYLERERAPRTVSADSFRKALHQAGVKVTTSPCRELKSPKAISVALGFWQ